MNENNGGETRVWGKEEQSRIILGVGKGEEVVPRSVRQATLLMPRRKAGLRSWKMTEPVAGKEKRRRGEKIREAGQSKNGRETIVSQRQ